VREHFLDDRAAAEDRHASRGDGARRDTIEIRCGRERSFRHVDDADAMMLIDASPSMCSPISPRRLLR